MSSTGGNVRLVYPESFVPIPWVLNEHSEEYKVYACIIEQKMLFTTFGDVIHLRH